jgi:hypothetical protein
MHNYRICNNCALQVLGEGVKYPEQWREYRRRHLLACYGMLGLSGAVIIGIALQVWAGFTSPAAFVALAVCWVSLWGFANFCPFCGVSLDEQM